MNAQCFKLVFSPRLAMYVPARETASSHAHVKSSRRRLRLALMASTLTLAPHAHALDGGALPQGGVVQGTGATINPILSIPGGNRLTIDQSAQKALIYWNTFNIGSGSQVIFNQPSSTASTLNKVVGGLGPQYQSIIEGSLKSLVSGTNQPGGHIYIINQNGILFGNGAQVDVGSLTASSLDVSDQLFQNGILSDANPAKNPVFSGNSGFVQVAPGATLHAASGGSIMLLAPQVENDGVIETSDGQVILAAGQKVYLASSVDPSTGQPPAELPAGLLVEVDAGGTATNLGSILATRGNATLVGLAVNQMGRITATTSAIANGSIRLLARDTVDSSTGTDTSTLLNNGRSKATHAGAAVLGAGSVTEVLPEVSDPTTTKLSEDFTPSRVEVQAAQVDIYGKVHAPAGVINISAVANPENPASIGTVQSNTRVYLGDGADIDASGLQGVDMPMDYNQLAIQLYSAQLQDAPLLRGGPLLGKTIYMDARTGTPLVDLTEALAGRSLTVAQRSASAGSVALSSEGDIVARSGSSVAVSGGSWQFGAGTIKTSKLLAQGQLVDIAKATPDRIYDGLADSYAAIDQKWGVNATYSLPGGYQPGYLEGKDAGSVTLNAPLLSWAGSMVARTHPGPYQHNAPLTGGTLDLGSTVNLLHDLSFVATPEDLPQGFSSTDPLPAANVSRLALDTSLLSNGFSSIKATTMLGKATLDAPIDLPAGGSLNIKANGIGVNADIVAPSATITLTNTNSNDSLDVAQGVTVSTAGVWTNDLPGVPGAGHGVVSSKGGQISLNSAGSLALGGGSLLDVSAGAWLKGDGSIAWGSPGAISINAGTQLALGGLLQGYGATRGGQLNIATGEAIQVGGAQTAGADVLCLGTAFFQTGGFTSYGVTNFTSDTSAAALEIGSPDGESVNLHPLVESFILNGDAASRPNGAVMDQVATPELLPDYVRAPTSVSLTAAYVKDNSNLGDVVLNPGATIQTDPGGSISLTAGHDLQIFGTLDAPGGNINLSIIGSPPANAPYDNSQASQALWIGPDAQLLAQGVYRPLPNKTGLLTADVLPGGNITLSASKGYLVLQTDSVLDVSGTSGLVDEPTLQGYVRQDVASDAGSISLAAREGLFVDGELRGHAGGAGAAGGSLSASLSAGDNPSPIGYGYPDRPRNFVLANQTDSLMGGLQPGQVFDANTYDGQAYLSADMVEKGGFDRLDVAANLVVPVTANGQTTYQNNARIDLEAGLNLSLATSLILDAPLVAMPDGGIANLHAGYVGLTNQRITQTNAEVQNGSGELNVQADWIDLQGQVALTDISHANLDSRLDVRAYGYYPSGSNISNPATDPGGLAVAGDLTIRARQLYPASGSSFTIAAEGSGRTLTVESSVESAVPLLSAGGNLILSADNIVQAGVVKAPLGSLEFDAGTRLDLVAGSLTSVSAEGQTIPYGNTYNSATWNLPGVVTAMSAPPAKSVVLQAPVVDTASSSVVDMSGGGEAFAYEWIKGIGGSQDILGQQGVYAILPTQASGYAPYDRGYSQGFDLPVGSGIYLAGVSNLPAGSYTLLPARYALLPGAYIVRSVSGFTNLLPGQTMNLQDGSTVVMGYGTVAGSGAHDALPSAYEVTPGTIFHPASGTVSRAPSEYQISTASQFFTAAASAAGKAVPRLPGDAGQLVTKVTDSLTLDLTLHAQPGAGGLGGLVDISNPDIEVVSALGGENGSLQLEATRLDDLGAESLLLGGYRSVQSGVTTITTTAQKVTVANDIDHGLTGPEILLAATDKVDVQAGASLTGDGTVHSSGNIALSGEGAFLRVAGSDGVGVTRDGVPSDPAQGSLLVGSGSRIKGNALILDATYASQLLGQLDVVAGGTLDIGAPRISMGDTTNHSVDGLILSDKVLASTDMLNRLVLRSYSGIDLYQAYQDSSGHALPLIDNPNLDLEIQAAGISGYAGSGESGSLRVGSLSLGNPGNAAISAPDGAAFGNQSLTLSANAVTMGQAASNPFDIQGFNEVKLVSATGISATGKGGLNIQAASATLDSPLITATGNADYGIFSSGVLNIVNGGSTAASAGSAGLGARLSLKGQSVTVGGASSSPVEIALPAGSMDVTATAGDVAVEQGATLNAAAVPTAFNDVVQFAPAGSISLTSTTGNVRLDNGAVLDVSASQGGGAGLIEVSATQGTAALAGEMRGQSTFDTRTTDPNTYEGGRFQLDARLANADTLATTNDFSSLNALLETGGFRGSRDIRLRQGDVSIASTDQVQTGNLGLTADAGRIDIYGAVRGITVASPATASQPEQYTSGQLAFYASGDVVLHTGASLSVDSNVAGKDGGLVVLATSMGSLDLQSGATVDTSGSTGGNAGQLLLRAPRNVANSDLGISALAADLSKAGSVEAEGFEAYTNVTNIGTATGTWYNDANDFMLNLPGIETRLGVTGNPAFQLRPGIEIDSTANAANLTDMTVASDWDLHAWRYDPQTGALATDSQQLASGFNQLGADGLPTSASQALTSGVLTLRATGDLTFTKSLSDGFSNATTTGALQGNASWSYRLVSGADLSASNPMMMLPANSLAGKGNFTLGDTDANPELIRTGSGSISIAAGGNLTIRNGSTAPAASAIYTAGRQAPSLAGFVIPDPKAVYGTDGGDIGMMVQGNISGAVGSGNNQQIVNNWLFRQGYSNPDGSYALQPSWWVRPDLFQENLAALGGGNITVEAGGDVATFSIAVPTSSQYVSTLDPDTGKYQVSSQIMGGGDLDLRAGGNIYSGVYYLGAGQGRIDAGGAIAKAGTSFGTVLAMQDARFTVQAGQGAYIESMFNPTIAPHSKMNAPTGLKSPSTWFFTYANDSSVHVSTTNGDLLLNAPASLANTDISSDIKSKTSGGLVFSSGTYTGFDYLPPELRATASQGSMTTGRLLLYPSAQGNLDLFANNDVNAYQLTLSDADTALLPTVENLPHSLSGGSSNIVNFSALGTILSTGDASAPIHQNDGEPLRVVALTGTIQSSGLGGDKILRLTSPKPVELGAGKDVIDLQASIQNLSPDDISVISAGRDFKLTGSSTASQVDLRGPGELLIEAGRDIDLGTQNTGGVVSTANSENPALDGQGGAITLAAGLGGQGADLESYIQRYLNPAGPGPAALAGDASALDAYQIKTAQAMADFLASHSADGKKYNGIDFVGLSSQDRQALQLSMFNDLEALGPALQSVFVYRHFSSELRNAGLTNAQTGSYARGDDAIAALFPAARHYNGDISLVGSKIRTTKDGSIDLLAPGGAINVGLPSETSVTGDIGIITEKGGDIRAFSDGGFLVNQSKVITQYGSDITIWVSNGDIDAGRGSKGAQAKGEKLVSVDVDGNLNVDYNAVATGSGIRTQTYDPDGAGSLTAPPKGTAYLIAPRGTLNASEAGIEAGNLFVFARQVLGAENIQVTGVSTGVPVANSSSLAAGLTGVSSLGNVSDSASDATRALSSSASDKDKAMQAAKEALANFSPSFITVEVIGFGETGTDSGDSRDCKKRNDCKSGD